MQYQIKKPKYFKQVQNQITYTRNHPNYTTKQKTIKIINQSTLLSIQSNTSNISHKSTTQQNNNQIAKVTNTCKPTNQNQHVINK